MSKLSLETLIPIYVDSFGNGKLPISSLKVFCREFNTAQFHLTIEKLCLVGQPFKLVTEQKQGIDRITNVMCIERVTNL